MSAADRNVEDVYELSPLQEGLLVESLANPGAGLYVEQVVLDLAGTLSPGAMARAWRLVVERHPILRTSFHWEGLERPVQVVHRNVRVPIAHNDLRGVPAERREAAIGWFLREDRAHGFRFDRPPLLRVAMLRQGSAAHRVVVTLHHILLDGWSVGIVMDEVALIYRSLVDGVPWHLEHARPYADYVAWLRDQDVGAAERYWRGALADLDGAPALSRLGGGVNGSRRRFEYAEHERTAPRALADQIRRTARERRITLNTVVLGAWAILLGAELATDDLVVGAVVSGRDVPIDRVETVVGLCINTVPLRIRIRPDRPVGQWLDDLQGEQLELRDFQHCALTDVQGWSGVPRGQPLFESIFIFENHATLKPRSQGQPAVSGRAFERTSYPLTVVVGVVPELSLKVLYDTSAVDDLTVERLTESLIRLLGEIGRNPMTPVGRLRWTTDEETRRVLELGEGPTVPVPAKPAHELFTQRTELDPDALAVVDGARRFSFRDVDRLSDELAHRIRKLSGGEDAVVGVFLEQSAELVAAVLGVLKAGAIYLPLDSSYPVERLRFMLEDSGARIVVSTSSLFSKLPAFTGEAALMDAPGAGEAGEDASLPQVSLDAAAWLLYTSGSSGLPKGVLGSHRGLVNRLAWGLREEPFAADEVCCLKTRLSFVDSLWELFGPLVAGVPLVVADEAAVRDPRLLAGLLVRERVTRLVAVPSLLAGLLELAPAELAGSRLRRLTSSGEPLTGGLARRLQELLPACRLLNLYGSTEVTADASWYALVGGGELEERVPIGRPLANVRVRVLGPAGELVPVGAVGELYVGGAGLALGYYGSAVAENEQRFLADRFLPGERLYRTGDLVRWRSDGQLEFVGRADRQLKLRGVRVEPAELEQVLQAHEAVREAAVVARAGPDGPELVAFVVLAEAEVSADTLRAYLRSRLPEQLVPAHLLPLEQLPRLPSGKLDRTTLAERSDTTARTQAYEPPVTPIEQAVVDVFTDLTGAEQVGRHDDFFALGGHSLLATRLVTALSSRFEITLPLAWVFEHPVVADLAQAVEEVLVAEIRQAALETGVASAEAR
jgi:amino acid adenylation domain-containing protein